MNKTLSVNIGGIVFHIEEQAYDRLNRYLDSIKSYFTTSDGRDEIMQDIEGRLGEMFQERISGGKQVIVESDVEHVINIMGKPEQFAEGSADTTAYTEPTSGSERRAYRRLYRDDDDRMVGGVCSGFSHYLGIDPIWLRIAFAVAFFVYGSGFLLYIILMVIMPKAKTTAEKLEMKGEQVNLSNIRKSVADEGKSNIESTGKRDWVANFVDTIGELLMGMLRIIGKIFAAFFIVIGIIILASFSIAFLALLGVGTVAIPFFITDMFMEPWQQSTAVIGAFLVVGIPVIMIIYKAVKVLFKIKTENKALNWTALALWIVGLGMTITVVSSVASEFKSRESERVDIPITQPASDTLNLTALNNGTRDYEWYFGDGNSVDFPMSINDKMDTIAITNVKLDVVKSTTDKFELVQISSSRGEGRKQAYENARAIKYSVQQNENNLSFSESFMLPKGSKFRDQKIQLVLKVPVGKSVYLSQEMVDIIYDIKNVTNTFDDYMVGRTWTMTEKGLECVGCGLPDNNFGGNVGDDVHIRINDQGVNIDGAASDSDSTFTINADDVKIKINDEGVQIDTKKK